MIRPAQRRLVLLTAAFGLSLLSCGREVTGPENGVSFSGRFAMLALAPEFTGPMAVVEGAGDAVPFEAVRVQLRNSDGSIAKDTLVDFPSTTDSVSLTITLPLPLNAPASGLPLSLTMAYINAAGDTVFRGGPSAVTARPIGSTGAGTPISITVTYDGAGKDASRVAIAPKSGTAIAGGLQSFTATAFDAQDQPIANTPFVFSSVDTTRATVNPVTGVATWRPLRGEARIVASLPNGFRADTATFTVALPATQLVLGAGDAQTGSVNAALADSIVVRTLASDGVPVAGVVVTFAVASGAGTLSALTDTSDALGEAKTAWTLGAALGAQGITATAAGLSGSPLAISATATAAAPARLSIATQPSAGTAGAALAPALTVVAFDAFGNPVPTFTEPVSIVPLDSVGPVPSGTLTRAAVAGTATFDDLSFTTAGAYQLVVRSGTLASDTSTAITVAAAAASQLQFQQQPLGAVAGAEFVPAITATVRDAFGNLATGFTGPVTLALLNGGAATLTGTLTQNAVAGVATFPGLSLQQAGVGYTLEATSGALQPDTSVAFAITAGAPAQFGILDGNNQTGSAGTPFPAPLRVFVRDAFGNPVANHPTQWADGGVVTLAATGTILTDSLGIAQNTATFGTVVGAQSGGPNVTTDGLGSIVVFEHTVTAGAAVFPNVIVAPAGGTVGVTLGSFSYGVFDQFNNLATGYNGTARVTLDPVDGNQPAPVILAGDSVDVVNGVATWNALVVASAGQYRIIADFGTELGTVVSDVLVFAPGTAATISVLSGDAQSDTVSFTLPQPLAVRVADQFGNAVPLTGISWTPSGPLSISATATTTDALGVTSIGVTLGTTAGNGTVQAALTDLPDSSVTFTVTALPGSAVALQVTATTATIAAGAAASYSVEAQDTFGNLATSFTQNVSVSATGPGGVGGTTTVAAVGGIATFTDLTFTQVGDYALSFQADGPTAAAATTTVTAGAANAMFIVSGDAQDGFTGLGLAAPIVVRVTDALSNAIVGDSVFVSVTTGGGLLANGAAVDTLITDAAGEVSIAWTLGATVGAQGLSITTTLVGPILASATAQAAAASVVWTGDVGSSVSDPANWFAGRAPSPADSVLIPAGRVNYPVLVGDGLFYSLSIADGASFDMGGFNLTVTGNLRAPLGAGLTGTTAATVFVQGAAGTLEGRMPALTLQGGYDVVGVLDVVGSVNVATGAQLRVGDADSLAVSGALTTAFAGSLVQTGNSAITVATDLQIGGVGSALGAGGRLSVGGNLEVVTASGVTADSAHTLQLTGATPTFSISTSSGNGFGSLLLDGTTAVTFVGDTVAFAGDVTLNGSSATFIASSVTTAVIGGRLTDAVGNRFLVASTVLTGTNAIATPELGGDRLILRGSSALAANFRVFGDLFVESGGTLAPNGFTAFVDDSLVTSGSGTIAMTAAEDTITVLGPALFNGGPSVLTDGRLRVQGRFDAGSSQGFQGQPTHTTEFFGVNSQQIGFSFPGFGPLESHLGRVELTKTGGAPASSTAVFVNGQLVTVGEAQVWTGVGQITPLNIRGASIGALSLPNQPLILVDGADVTQLDGLRFTGFGGTAVTQLSIQRSGGTVVLGAPAFDSLATAPVEYLFAADVSPDADTLTVNVSAPAPLFHLNRIASSGGARILNWSAFESLLWTGAVSTDWFDPANWQQNAVPSAGDSVVVSSAVNLPALNAPTTIRALDWQGVDAMTLSADLTVRQTLNAGLGSAPVVTCTGAGRVTLAPFDSATAQGWVDCPLHVTTGLVRPVAALQVDSLIIEGDGYFLVRDEFINVAHDLRTAGSGTLGINGSLNEGTVSVSGRALFESTPIEGALVNGNLVLYGDLFQQVSATAFRPTSGHTTRFAGLGAQTVFFQNPEPINGSYFGNLSIEQGEVSAFVSLQSDTYVEGSLIGEFGTRRVFIAGSGVNTLLRSRGAAVGLTGGLNFSNVRWEIVDGGTLPSDLYNVIFANQDGDATRQLRIARTNGAVTLHQFQFDTTATNPIYLEVEDLDAPGAETLSVAMDLPSPLYYGTGLSVLGGALVTGWESAPLFVWSAVTDPSWDNPANWIDNIVPNVTSDVVIPTDAIIAPVLAQAVSIRSLDVRSTSLSVNAGTQVLTVSDSLVAAAGGTGVLCETGEVIITSAGTAALRGAHACPVTVTAGTVLATGAVSVDQLTVAGSGVLDANAQSIAIGGSLVTSGGGILRMTTPLDTVVVGATARFAGGPTSGTLTDGLLRVNRSFAQFDSTSAGSFAPSGSHRTVLGDSTDIIALDLPFTLQFARPDASWFRDLYIAGGWFDVIGTARVLGPARVRNNIQLQGGRIEADSGFRATSALVSLGSISVAGAFELGGSVSVDTVEFRGPAAGEAQQEVPAAGGASPFPYQTLIVAGPSVVMTDSTFAYGIAEALRITAGDLTFGSSISVLGDFATFSTLNDGRFSYAAGPPGVALFDSVYVATSAVVAPSTGSLSFRSFVQQGVANFQPSGGFIAVKNGSGVIGFADESGAVYFNNLQLSPSSATTLTSALTVNGRLSRVVGEGQVFVESDILDLNARPLTVNGGLGLDNIGGGGTTLRNVRLNLRGSYATASELVFNGVTFERMDPNPTVPYLRTEHTGGTAVTWNDITFNTTLQSGLYFQWDTGVNDGSSITFVNATPAVDCLAGTCVQTDFAPLGTEPLATWTGAVDATWTNTGNWLEGAIPTASSHVIIQNTATNIPTIPGSTQLGRLTVDAGQTAHLAATGIVTVFGDVDVQGRVIGLDPSATLQLRTADTSFVGTGTVGSIDARLEIAQGIGSVDGLVQLAANVVLTDSGGAGNLAVSGGTLDLNGFAMSVAGDFSTFSSGRLQMNSASPVLTIGGSAFFDGASTDGLLTTGEMRITGNLTQSAFSSPASFVGSGSHAVVFDGAGNSEVSFATSDTTTGSRIAVLRNEKDNASLFLPSGDLFVDTLPGSWTADFYVGELAAAHLYVRSTIGVQNVTYGFRMGPTGFVTLLSGTAGCTASSVLVLANFANFTPALCAFAP